ncbi:ethanolamine ammonia-lyase subunit EutC [Hydrogenophaga sp.]|uniref:ethanolamine ammonia-lyase subunit EutC n=1 Tax=Hydrogenophaga sp. TaxID=1904254 RepID=UPI0025C738B9|nr:ethanolamine ammonia-lyase subunit EutC [Hydrogenophaga sp.]
MKPAVVPPLVTPADWGGLRRFTDARIALGRSGHSQPTAAHLAFQLAHAQARDAVYATLDEAAVSSAVEALGLVPAVLSSAAPSREAYLQRPDWGRRLDAPSRDRWQALQPRPACPPADLVFVIADGLSSRAVNQHAVPLLAHLLPLLRGDPAQRWLLAPVALVRQGRVAVGDEVGELLYARCSVVLIGERPGLSSPDSLGVYFTWAPRVGRTDAQRNCISNVRQAGLSPERAAHKLYTLLTRARALQLSGLALKDESDGASETLTNRSTFTRDN